MYPEFVPVGFMVAELKLTVSILVGFQPEKVCVLFTTPPPHVTGKTTPPCVIKAESTVYGESPLPANQNFAFVPTSSR
jgi:hypothetical protein